MLYCKTCKGWFHGECVPYKCDSCSSIDQNKKEEKQKKIQDQLACTKNELEVAKTTLNQSKKDLKERDNMIKELRRDVANSLRTSTTERKQQETSHAAELKNLEKQNQALQDSVGQLEKEKEEQAQTVTKIRRELDMVNEEIKLNSLRTRELREQHQMYKEKTEKELERARKLEEEKSSDDESDDRRDGDANLASSLEPIILVEDTQLELEELEQL